MRYSINYNFSEKTTIKIAAETVLREDIIGKT
jgi:hypothetical protein